MMTMATDDIINDKDITNVNCTVIDGMAFCVYQHATRIEHQAKNSPKITIRVV